MISPFIERVVSGDTVLVNRLGQSYKVDVDDLFTNPTDDDILLVNYQGQSYKLKVNDVTSTDKDSAIILVNREVDGEWKSFRSTLGELKGVAVQDVTFNVEIRTPKISWYYSANTRPGCPNPVQGEVNGGKITATVTAKSNQTYQFQNGTLYIDGEWILCCGSSGEDGWDLTWSYRQLEQDYEVCYSAGFNENTQQSKGLSAVGVSNIGPGQEKQSWGNGPQPNSSGTYGEAGAGGFGCPAGNRTGSNNKSPGEGGYSQSRPRAEDSGDTWNDITVTNISHSNGRWDGYNAISANGITLTNNSGVIGDLIPAPPDPIYSDGITVSGNISTGLVRKEQAFDGVTTQSADDAARVDIQAGGTGKMIFDFGSGITNVTSIEVWTYNDPSDPKPRTINAGGSNYVITTGQASRYNWEELTGGQLPPSGTLTTLEVTVDNSSSGGTAAILVGGIRVNGTILIDG